MAQSAKFIDVTRSYLPVDPNAFPESMHGTSGEDSPEARIPASAYAGHNFLPTSYGYKSYFGTNQSVGIAALTSRVDYVFTFQNETFSNYLIALCEDGIWIKDGGVAGAWTHLRTIAAPANPNTHFEWTFVIISDQLFCYMSGISVVFKIVSQAAAPGYVCTDLAPNFLNMPAQVGIFRAGGRLGFWDTADSVAWSSLDDFADFTPSIETLAGNSLFSDVNGRIVTIRPHGAGFIIYASKSIVYVGEAAETTYQWKPTVIMSDAGIAYPRQCTVSSPDTTHFAYTSIGLFKIENYKQQNIVPEVTDFLKESVSPIYVKVMEGRYLFLENLDPDYFNGLAQFTDEVVPEDAYNFPGNTTPDHNIDDAFLVGDSFCNVINIGGLGGYPDQQPGGTHGGTAIFDKKDGTTATAVWKCWISNNAGNPDDITFDSSICSATDPNGVVKGMTPVGKGNKLSAMTENSSNKVGLLGSDVYVDGIWTIERFISVQTAIWDKQKSELGAFIGKILSRSAEGQKITDRVGTCTESDLPSGECILGDYVSNYSEPQFGMSACQFWLTRYALSAVTLKTVVKNKIACEFFPTVNVMPLSMIWHPEVGGTPPTFPSSLAACAVFASPATSETTDGTDYGTYASCYRASDHAYTGNAASQPVCESWQTGVTNGPVNAVGVYWRCQDGAHYKKSEYMWAYNKAVDKPIAPTPETAYCEIVGWKYTKTDGTQGYQAAASCTAPKIYPKNETGYVPNTKKPVNTEEKNYPISGMSGSICSDPFEPVVIPGSPSTSVDWPDVSVTIPAGSFLLQKGSIAPVYPNMFGALVYDLYLKKWGKYKGGYKQLLDYQPLNDQSGGGIPYNRFGMMAGVIKSDGLIYLFDAFPTDSQITYGKIGYYRKGMTSPEEVRVDFKSASSGSLSLNGSLDGRVLGVELVNTVNFDSQYTAQLFGGSSARWHNITIAGIYDITYLEFRGVNQTSRR